MASDTPTDDARPTIDLAEVRRGLAIIFTHPDAPIELRGIKRVGKKASIEVWRFHGDEAEAAAAKAAELSDDGRNVYAVMNLIGPDFAKPDRRGGVACKGAVADKDVVRRLRLLVDCDPTRPAETSSTDAEKAAALATTVAVRDYLRSLDFPQPILSDSGNGAHLIYAIDQPAEDLGLVKRCLESLARRFDTPAVKVDTVVANPSRICKVPGTVAQKGPHTAERPHRLARVVEMPETLKDVPSELLEALADTGHMQDIAAAEARAATVKPGRLADVSADREPWTPRMRAEAYSKRTPPAVSGSAGHNQTIKFACDIYRGFDLTRVEAEAIVGEWNATCDPPWSDREIEHKLDEAEKDPRKPGWKLDVDRPRSPSLITIPFPGVVSSNPNEAQPNEAADDPSRLARLHLDAHCRQGDDLTLLFRQGDFLDWDGAYRQCSQEHLRAVLHSTIKAEFNRLNLVALAIHDREKIAEAAPGEGKENETPKEKRNRPIARKVTGALVSNTMLALSGYTRIEPRIAEPSWLRGPGPFSADDVLPMRNALVHLPSLVAGDPAAIHPPTPRYYCPYCLDYGFDADAPEPTRWLEFMQSVFPHNPESIDTLQEWFGHMLTPDTSQQKILMIIGPRRSGKGTVARLLRGMLSPENVANPSLGGLATNFGLAPLIGKPAAIITDARLSGRTDIAQIVERLLSISGEDAVTIDRKHMAAVTVKLPSRFTFISNELPRLTDTSGALAGRMLILPMRESFYNREDTRLTATLMTELPGILLWAIAGWQRLRERGWFVQPEAGVAMVGQLEDLGSPVGAFLKERCRIAPGGETMAANLYQAWKAWCAERGRDNAGDELGFGRNLHAILPNLKVTSRRQLDGSRKRFYEGIYLDK